MRNQILNSNPIFSTIFITNACNLHCRHCIFSSGVKSPNELSDSEVIDLITKLTKLGVICLDFSGGETLLRPSVFKFINFAYNSGIKFVSLATNGTLISQKTIEDIEKLKNKGRQLNLRISLDGDEESHDWLRGDGTFKKIIRGLEILRRNNIRPREINFVLHKNNVNKIEKLVKIIEPYKPHSLIIMPLVLGGRAKNYMNKFQIDSLTWRNICLKRDALQKKYPKIEITIDGPTRAILEKNLNLSIPKPCMCGMQYIGFSSEGDILVCPISLLSVGNIRKDKDIEKIWSKSPMLKKIRNLQMLKDKCRHCKFKIVCRGGCRGLAESIYGDVLMPDPLCWL